MLVSFASVAGRELFDPLAQRLLGQTLVICSATSSVYAPPSIVKSERGYWPATGGFVWSGSLPVRTAGTARWVQGDTVVAFGYQVEEAANLAKFGKRSASMLPRPSSSAPSGSSSKSRTTTGASGVPAAAIGAGSSSKTRARAG